MTLTCDPDLRCQYEFRRGRNAGAQVCPRPVAGSGTGALCWKHFRQEMKKLKAAKS